MKGRITGKNSFLWGLLLLLTQGVAAQQTDLRFLPLLGGEPLILGADAGAKRVNALRFYLSDPVLLRDGEVVFTSPKRHHLVDAEVPASLRLPLDLPPDLAYDQVRFTLGVDSLSSSAGVFGGDLDPTKGMYWTWRSGYIHFKLEGTAPECPARKQAFQFHVGGFQSPFSALREVVLDVHPGKDLPIVVDLDAFFREVDLSTHYRIMSPGEPAVKLADALPRLFYLKH